jgi:hypothetical protein
MEHFQDLSYTNLKKDVPKNHNIEVRYKSYDRANEYIKHLIRVFDNSLQKSAEYDSSCLQSLNFKSKLPQVNGKYKISMFPTVQINKEVLKKIDLINAYNSICETPVSRYKINSRYKNAGLSPTKIEGSSIKKIKNPSKSYSFCTKCNFLVCVCSNSPTGLKFDKTLKTLKSLNRTSGRRQLFPDY